MLLPKACPFCRKGSLEIITDGEYRCTDCGAVFGVTKEPDKKEAKGGGDKK